MTKKTKSMVLAIMSVAIISLAGIYVVDAAQQPTNNIPTNTVVERTSEIWVNQYKSVEEFEKVTKETIQYLTADMEPGWNKDIQQASLKAYNFESMIGKRGAVNELVVLFSAREQILGSHTTSEAVSKYHNWMQSQFDTPKDIDIIDKRINEIIGKESNYKFAIEAYEARNFQASLGAVPEQVTENDVYFWGEILAFAGCIYDERCDVKELRKTLSFGPPLHNTPEETKKLMDDPSTAAWDDTFHVAYQYISANTCDGSPCYFYTTTSGVGQLTPNASSGGIHTTDTTIYSYASSYGGNTGDYHTVSSQLTDPTPTNTLFAAGYDQVSKTGYLTKSSSETTYKATNTSNAYDP